MATPLAAAGAYANAARLAANPSSALAGLAAGTDKNQTSFSSVLKEAVNALHETGHQSDVQTRNMVAGKSNMVGGAALPTSVAHSRPPCRSGDLNARRCSRRRKDGSNTS